MKKLTHEEFLQKLKEKNEHYITGQFEVVGEYINSYTKLIIENKYGKCLVLTNNLLTKNINPSIKSAIDKTQYFINQAREVHGDKYDYSKVDYKHGKNKVTIICSEHGGFGQKPNDHLQKYGCLKCKNESNSFKLTDWCEQCNNNVGTFYVLRCWNKNEEFYKIGITCRGVKERYSNNKLMPYNHEIVKEVSNSNRKLIWELEKYYKEKLKPFKFYPSIYFKGSKNECFKI